MGWANYFPLIAGLGTLWFLGDSPSWSRTIIGCLLGVAAGFTADIAWPWLLRLPPEALRHWVMLQLIGPFGLTFNILYVPLAVLAAAVAARRQWVRIRDPNDLRR
jgi:hypothetical protein